MGGVIVLLYFIGLKGEDFISSLWLIEFIRLVLRILLNGGMLILIII